MNNPKRTSLSGTALPVDGNDIDTDRIIPARYLRAITFEGLGEHAFEDDRKQLREAGKVHPFDDPARQNARILVVGRNFGCGSSREHAPQSLARFGAGITALVGESFSEIFFGNCVALGLPCVTASADDLRKLAGAVKSDAALDVTVDLVALEVRFRSERIAISIPEGARRGLVSGSWDSLAELLASHESVRKLVPSLPYFANWV